MIPVNNCEQGNELVKPTATVHEIERAALPFAHILVLTSNVWVDIFRELRIEEVYTDKPLHILSELAPAI